MASELSFIQAMRQTKIWLPPKHHLATFGSTSLRYVMLSAVPESERLCRLRVGAVTASRPTIVTPDTWRERFAGFGDDSRAYNAELEKIYGDSFRALEYTFKNNLESAALEHAPLAEVVERTRDRLTAEDAPRTALLEGPDGMWSLSVMKCIVETSLRSFPGNVREMDERGLFDPAGRETARRKRDIEALFQAARRDATLAPQLAARLKEWGLFADYEDRFFGLFPR